MDKRAFKCWEITGVFVGLILSVLFWNLYELSGHSIIAVIFASVNQSIWESLKGLIISYVIYSGLELFTIKVYFRQFVVAKSWGLYSLIASYILLRYLLSDSYNLVWNIVITLFSFIIGFCVSYVTTTSKKDYRELFMSGFLLLVLIFVMYFCFSLFPPKLSIFRDVTTGYYGIMPENQDVGAIVLDSLE